MNRRAQRLLRRMVREPERRKRRRMVAFDIETVRLLQPDKHYSQIHGYRDFDGPFYMDPGKPLPAINFMGRT